MCSKYEEISVMYFLSSSFLEMKYITLTPEKTTAWKKTDVFLRPFFPAVLKQSNTYVNFV